VKIEEGRDRDGLLVGAPILGQQVADIEHLHGSALPDGDLMGQYLTLVQAAIADHAHRHATVVDAVDE
jgi:hypothetical protein